MDHSQPPASRNSAAYQVMLVALLSLNFGIVFFDRNALNFLMPFVQPDLGLSNTQVGILASALSLTWACAAFGIGVVSDRTGSRKGLLILATLAFSACSFLSGLAASFAALLGARLLMGAAEGGIMPISQAMIASEVRPEQRGLAMGVTQNFGSNLLGSFVAPVLLVAFATAFGWRHAFFLAGIPGIVAALLMWRFIREPARPSAAATQAAAGPTMTLAAGLSRAQRTHLRRDGHPARLLSRGLLGLHAVVPYAGARLQPADHGLADGHAGNLGDGRRVPGLRVCPTASAAGR